MQTKLTKCNFLKFINFIRTIDGEFKDVDDFHIMDRIYDDSWLYNEDELANCYYSGYNHFLKTMRDAFKDDTSFNTSIIIADDEHYYDSINIRMSINDNPTYVLQLEESIYKEKINEWLSNNAQHIIKEV